MANTENGWVKTGAVVAVIGLLLGLLGSSFAFGGRMTKVETRVDSIEKTIQEDRQDRREISKALEEIRTGMTQVQAEQRILHGMPPDRPVTKGK